MSIENSDLNDSPALKQSNESLKGGSGDGNRFTIGELERGYLPVEREPALSISDLPYLPGDL